jgi:hypothetical protein
VHEDIEGDGDRIGWNIIFFKRGAQVAKTALMRMGMAVNYPERVRTAGC